MTTEVLTRIEGRAGRITLTRPEALHALTLSMCEAMIEALLAWREDPRVELVMLDHEGGRGFCAGGDIRALYDSVLGDGALADRFFFTEYRLDHLLSVYPKPVVAVMDGIVMGGGAGIALPARYRIATERTVFAMPECGIGLFPDVGASWRLARLQGRAGVWLALTGARLDAAGCHSLGLATHKADTSGLETLKAALAEGRYNVDEILTPFAGTGGPTPLSPHQDRLFAGESVEAILAALDADGGTFAAESTKAIRAKCPTMLKVALELQRRAAGIADLADEFALEYALAVRTVRRADFAEGVRAAVIDKDQSPRWSPATLEAMDEAMVAAMFEPLPSDRAWTPLP